MVLRMLEIDVKVKTLPGTKKKKKFFLFSRKEMDSNTPGLQRF